MTKNVLSTIASAMTAKGIEYAFGEYKKTAITYPYFVGEYVEAPSANEDGSENGTFILNGFSRTTFLALETAKGIIEEYFTKYGKHFVQPDGSVITIAYNGASQIQTDDAELKRIQINLDVTEWMVN